MTEQADAIVEKYTKAPHLRMSPAEATVLAAVTSPSLMMRKMLGIYHFQREEHAEALAHADAVFQEEATSENAKNVALLMRKTGDLRGAIAFTRTQKGLIDAVTWNDLLCMMLTQVQDFKGAARHGTEALRLKDRAAGKAAKLSPVTRPFDGTDPKKNVISFSLWGNSPRYLTGAQNNAIVARYLYPGWSVRFYVDRSVPDAILKVLVAQGADVRIVREDLPAGQYGLFWRFLVEDDPGVERYLIRDADSVMNIKERVAVQDWLASGRAFHVMRDYPAHSELILAGMWGAQRGNLGSMRERFVTHVTGGAKRLNNKITDQEFLRTEIWPIVRQDVLQHDAWFDFGNPSRFPDGYDLPGLMHIGQNDSAKQAPGGR